MRLKKIVIWLFCMLFLLILKNLNILQGVFSNIVVIALASVFISLFLTRVDMNIDENQDQKRISYVNLDIMRWICAIFIIILHLRPFSYYNDILDLTFNNMVGRIGVPLFFLITGYFIALKIKDDPKYVRTYIKKNMPTYLFWSILYIPLGFGLMDKYNIAIDLWPLALIVGLFYFGTYYHLWYFPALFLGMGLFNILLKKISINKIVILSFLLLCFGATETYYGILPVGAQNLLHDYYYGYFYTTRNFLFFSLFYIALGYYIGITKDKKIKHCFPKFVISCILLVVETMFLQLHDRLDSNILFSCIPLVYYLFHTMIYTRPLIPDASKYRGLSKYYYLIHPFVIYYVCQLFLLLDILKDQYILKTIIIIGVTHVISRVIILVKRKTKALPITIYTKLRKKTP